MKIKIDIWAANNDYLILEGESGCIYTSQAGGTACSHPEIEGYAVPLTMVYLEELAKATCKYSCGGGNLYDENLEEYSKLLPKFINGFSLEIDKTRFQDGQECHIPVKAIHNETNIKFDGWLMLKDNCD